MIAAIFLLGVGTTLLIDSSINKQRLLLPRKLVEISKEATSTSKFNSATASETSVVKRVIDGDTIELSDNRRVRYIGINAPEIVDLEKSVECFGQEAALENRKLVEGKTVKLTKDVSETDKYGRLLRFVYVDDTFVNDYLVREGFARVMPIAPDVTLAGQLRQAQTEAKDNNLGLWSQCTNL